MALQIYSKLKEKGFIMTPYSAIRTLPENEAIVLMELLAELNHARNIDLNYGDDFLCDINRLSAILNIEWNLLLEILKGLQELGFIAIFDPNIEDTIYIRVKQDNIINYIETNDGNNFMNWNDGLIISLNPINKGINFNQSTLRIKDYLDSYLQIPEAIPLIYYSYLNCVIEDYEKVFGDFFENVNIHELTQDFLDIKEINALNYQRSFKYMVKRISKYMPTNN